MHISSGSGWRRLVGRALAPALVLISFAVAGCSANGESVAFTPDPAGPAPRVQPGDRIALKIFEEEEMSDTFNVAGSGEAILPRLGAVPVAGAEVAALQDSLRVAYSRYLRNPSVEVTVLRRVGVHGEVEEPGLYLVDLTMTLRDLIAEAGGITEEGDPAKIYVTRGDQRIRFRSEGSSAIATAELRSGDQVTVGQRPWIQRNSLAFASTAAVVISLVMPILRDVF